MQQWGENYWETYSLIVNMTTVKLLLVVAKTHGVDSKSIDFVLAFPQAKIKTDSWMELPIGFEPDGESDAANQFVLMLNKSLYGLKRVSFPVSYACRLVV